MTVKSINLQQKKQSASQGKESIIGDPLWLGIVAVGIILVQRVKGIGKCVEVDLQTGRCSLCYNSTPLLSGELCGTGDTSHEGCLLVGKFETLSTKCLQCEPDYFRFNNKCFVRSTAYPGITNCTSYSGFSDSEENLRCEKCSSGPHSLYMKRCLAWSETQPNRMLKDCLVGGRDKPDDQPFCWVCQPGFSYDTALKRCVKSKTEGCWRSHLSECVSCNPWAGYEPEPKFTKPHQPFTKSRGSRFCKKNSKRHKNTKDDPKLSL